MRDMFPLVSHANEVARNVLASDPEDKLYVKFSKPFSTLSLDQLHLWVWTNEIPFLTARGIEVHHWVENHLGQESFGRDDFHELCKLIVHYLGGNIVRI